MHISMLITFKYETRFTNYKTNRTRHSGAGGLRYYTSA